MTGQLILGLILTVPAWLLGELIGGDIVIWRKRCDAIVARQWDGEPSPLLVDGRLESPNGSPMFKVTWTCEDD